MSGEDASPYFRSIDADSDESEEELDVVKPVGRAKWSPWNLLCVVELEANGHSSPVVEIPIDIDTNLKALTTTQGLLDIVGGKPKRLYFRNGTGRGGITRVSTEAEWSQLLTHFLDTVPRSAATIELLQRAGSTLLSGCTAADATSGDARWEAKPYASSAFVLKDVVAVAHDPRAHNALLRYTLPFALQALAHRWSEGTLVASNVVELLCQLVDQQENMGWLSRIPLFETLLKARQFYADPSAAVSSPYAQHNSRSGFSKPPPLPTPSSLDNALLRLFAVMCRTPFGKRLIINSEPAAAMLVEMFMSSYVGSVGVGSLRAIASCLPLSPKHITPVLPTLLPTLQSLLDDAKSNSHAAASGDELRLAVMSVLAASLCRGLPPSPDALHMVVTLGLWSVCLDANNHIFRAENRAEVEEYEERQREKEAKRAAYANLATSSPSTHPLKSVGAGFLQSKSQKLTSSLAAYAVWSFLSDLVTRLEAAPDDINFDTPQACVLKVDDGRIPPANIVSSSSSSSSNSKDGPPYRTPAVALTLKHQLSRCIVVLEALLKLHSDGVAEGVCGSLSCLLRIHKLVHGRGSHTLQSLNIVGVALEWISRLAAKICKAKGASLLHRVGLNLVVVLSQTVTTPSERSSLWESAGRGAVLPAISELTQTYIALYRIDKPKELEAPPSSRRVGSGNVSNASSRTGSGRIGDKGRIGSGSGKGLRVGSGKRDGRPPKREPSADIGKRQRASSGGSAKSKSSQNGGTRQDRPNPSNTATTLEPDSPEHKENLLVSLRLAAEAMVALCKDSGVVCVEDMTALLNLFKVPDPDVIGSAALALWGVCLTPQNRALAVSRNAVLTLCSWSAVLLLAANKKSRSVVIDQFATCPTVVTVHERVLAALWQCISCPEGVAVVASRHLASGLIDILREPTAATADLQYLAISVVWRTVLSKPADVMPIVLQDMLPETLFAYVAEPSDVPPQFKLYALRCLLSLYTLHRSGVVTRLTTEYGPYPMERIILHLLNCEDDVSKAEGAAIMSCFHSKVSKRRLCELGAVSRLLALLSTCANERTMLACLYTLLNMSTDAENQREIGRVSFPVLLEICRSTNYPHMAAVATKVVENVSKHFANRTELYKAELFYRRLDNSIVSGNLSDIEREYLSARGLLDTGATPAEPGYTSPLKRKGVPSEKAPDTSVLSRMTVWLHNIWGGEDGGEGKEGGVTVESDGKLDGTGESRDASQPFKPALVAFPDTPRPQVNLNASMMTSSGPSLDSTFLRPKGPSSQPLHTRLCSKLSSLYEFSTETGDSVEGDTDAVIVMPAGSGCCYDPGRTGSFTFGDDGEQDVSLSSTTGKSKSLGKRGIPAVLAVDGNSAFTLGGTIGSGDQPSPGKATLALKPVIAQRQSNVKTVKANKKTGNTQTQQLSMSVLSASEFSEAERPKTTPNTSALRTLTKTGSVKAVRMQGRQSEDDVRITTMFELDKSKSKLVPDVFPAHLKAGMEGDRVRRQLAQDLASGKTGTVKRTVRELHSKCGEFGDSTKPKDKSKDKGHDGEGHPEVVQLATVKVVKEGRRVGGRTGNGGQHSQSTGSLPTIGSTAQLKSTGGSSLAESQATNKLFTKPEVAWWDSTSGSPWDVNVSSYTVTSIKNIHSSLLAGETHEAGERKPLTQYLDAMSEARKTAMETPSPILVQLPASPSPSPDRRGGRPRQLPPPEKIEIQVLEPVSKGIIGRGESVLALEALPQPDPAGTLDPLKVVVGNATSRHGVKFHWPVSDGDGGMPGGFLSSPTVKMNKFDHIPGAGFCKHLYPHYQLPDGRTVHFYFIDKLHETVFEYVNSGPDEPSTLTAIRQTALNTDAKPMLMSLESLPPVIAPPVIPPPLIPDLEQIRQEMHFIVKPVTASSPGTRSGVEPFGGDDRTSRNAGDGQSTSPVPSASGTPVVQLPPTPTVVADEKVWGLRSDTSESKDSTNAQAVVWRNFEKYWDSVEVKAFVDTILDKTTSKPKFAESPTICDGLFIFFRYNSVVFRQCFEYFAAKQPLTAFPVTMKRQGLHDFIVHMKFVGRVGSPLVFRSVDSIIQVMFPGGEASGDGEISLRAFVIGFIRLAERVRSRLKGQPPSESLEDGVRMLFKKFIMPNFPVNSNLDEADRYRINRLYASNASEVLATHSELLQALFDSYASATSANGKHKMMTLANWMAFVHNAELLDEYFTIREAQLCFLWSRMLYSEITAPDANAMFYTDFMEALCRMADLKFIPMDGLQQDRDMLRWNIATAKDTKERCRRLSMEWFEGSQRPLGDKLSKLLNLTFLALDYTMGRKCGLLVPRHVATWSGKYTPLPTVPSFNITSAVGGKGGRKQPGIKLSDVLHQLPVYTEGAEADPVVVIAPVTSGRKSPASQRSGRRSISRIQSPITPAPDRTDVTPTPTPLAESSGFMSPGMDSNTTTNEEKLGEDGVGVGAQGSGGLFEVIPEGSGSMGDGGEDDDDSLSSDDDDDDDDDMGSSMMDSPEKRGGEDGDVLNSPM